MSVFTLNQQFSLQWSLYNTLNWTEPQSKFEFDQNPSVNPPDFGKKRRKTSHSNFQKNTPTRESMHCVLSLTAQCIVVGPVCGGRALFVGVFVGLLPR